MHDSCPTHSLYPLSLEGFVTTFLKSLPIFQALFECDSLAAHLPGLNVAPLQHSFLDLHELPSPASLSSPLPGTVLWSSHLTCPDGGEALKNRKHALLHPLGTQFQWTKHVVGAQ